MIKKVNAIQTIDTEDLVKKADGNKKVVEVEKKISDHIIYYYIINTFSKLLGAVLVKRSKQAT